MDGEIKSGGFFLHKPQDTGFGMNDTRLRAKSLDFYAGESDTFTESKT